MKHPNLLSIDYVLNKKNEIFLILPFAKGGDMYKLFKKEIREPKQILDERMILFWAI